MMELWLGGRVLPLLLCRRYSPGCPIDHLAPWQCVGIEPRFLRLSRDQHGLEHIDHLAHESKQIRDNRIE